jgi:hypothetical protein
MKLSKQIIIVLIIFIALSCSKSENPSYKDLLIREKYWYRFNDPLLYYEQIGFNADMSYRLELLSQFDEVGRTTVPYNISGTWEIDKDKIIFTKSELRDYPKVISDSGLLWRYGSPITKFYGYKYNRVYRNDSIIIQFSDTAQERTWKILKLNNDSLVIDSNGQIVTYYHF